MLLNYYTKHYLNLFFFFSRSIKSNNWIYFSARIKNSYFSSKFQTPSNIELNNLFEKFEDKTKSNYQLNLPDHLAYYRTNLLPKQPTSLPKLQLQPFGILNYHQSKKIVNSTLLDSHINLKLIRLFFLWNNRAQFLKNCTEAFRWFLRKCFFMGITNQGS